ncbi:hypothetical protein D3C80_1898430 [compost metagenome]
MMVPASGPLTMPAIIAAIRNTAVMRARSAGGNQYVRYRMTPGKKPASATPSRNRATINWFAVVTKAVATVTMPHSTMMRVSVARAPMRCRYRLLGTSNRMYPR